WACQRVAYFRHCGSDSKNRQSLASAMNRNPGHALLQETRRRGPQGSTSNCGIYAWATPCCLRCGNGRGLSTPKGNQDPEDVSPCSIHPARCPSTRAGLEWDFVVTITCAATNDKIFQCPELRNGEERATAMAGAIGRKDDRGWRLHCLPCIWRASDFQPYLPFAISNPTE